MVKKNSKFAQKFIQDYGDDSNKGYILEIDVGYPKRRQKIHSNLPSLPKRMKTDKCQKHVCNMYGK